MSPYIYLIFFARTTSISIASSFQRRLVRLFRACPLFRHEPAWGGHTKGTHEAGGSNPSEMVLITATTPPSTPTRGRYIITSLILATLICNTFVIYAPKLPTHTHNGRKNFRHAATQDLMIFIYPPSLFFLRSVRSPTLIASHHTHIFLLSSSLSLFGGVGL